MASDSDERRSVLLAVRDQAKVLRGQPPTQGNSEAWTPQQWWQSFDYLFVQSSSGSSSKRSHEASDDLLFFVTREAPTVPPPAPQPKAGRGAGKPPYFVRRKAKQLPEELQLSGASFERVDWCQSVLLNVVLQSQYSLTVVACGQESLPFVAEGRTWTPNTRTVTKPVYASPTVTAVNVDDTRAGDAQPVSCYPDICFAVDNFGDAFEDMVLQELDNCYCVVLHAMADSCAPSARPAGSGYADLGALAARLGAAGGKGGGAASTSAAAAAPKEEQAAAASGSPRAPGLPDAAHLAERMQQVGLSGSPRNATPPASPWPPGGGVPGLTALTAEAAAASSSATAASADGGSVPGSPLGWQIGTRKRTLFAGYVAFSQILDFMAANKKGGLIESLFSAQGAGPQKDKIVMTGPGGTGRAEVAVTKQDKPPKQPVGASDPGLIRTSSSAGSGAGGPAGEPPAQQPQQQPQQQLQQQQQQQQQGGGLFQRARQLATGLQKAIYDINDGQAGPYCNMQCALMLLKLPISYLAQELLEAV